MSRVIEYLTLDGIIAKVVGSPKTVLNELECWGEIADANGFDLSYVTNPVSFEDTIDSVVLELQKCGLFHTEVEKEGVTAWEAYLGSR